MDKSESPEALVKKAIGTSTYAFLSNDQQFDRILGLLVTSQKLINSYKGGKLPLVMILGSSKSEYSYIVAPAAKALEGALLKIAFKVGAINQTNLSAGVQVGSVYSDLGGKPAIMKSFVLRERDKGVVNSMYGNWTMFRNKTLHYDDNFFVNTRSDAEVIVSDIYRTIKVAYQTFIGKPDYDINNLPFIIKPGFLRIKAS